MMFGEKTPERAKTGERQRDGARSARVASNGCRVQAGSQQFPSPSPPALVMMLMGCHVSPRGHQTPITTAASLNHHRSVPPSLLRSMRFN